jgi:hypothetical protein
MKMAAFIGAVLFAVIVLFVANELYQIATRVIATENQIANGAQSIWDAPGNAIASLSNWLFPENNSKAAMNFDPGNPAQTWGTTG